jgi:putative plasmid recombination enzyme
MGAIFMQISFLNNIKKINSKTGKNTAINFYREAMRELDGKYNNNVNLNLSKKNIVLVNDKRVLDRQFYDTEVNSRANDIICCVSKLNSTKIQAKIGEDITFFADEKRWRGYFEENLKFLQNQLGNDAKCVYAVIHLDEGEPHLQMMFCLQRKQENKAVYSEKDVDMEKVKKNLKKSFSKYCKVQGINKQNFGQFSEKKTWKEFQENYFEKNREEKIKKQIEIMNKKTDVKSFIFPSSASVRMNYKKMHQNWLEIAKKNEDFLEIKSNLETALGEPIEVVSKMTEKLNDGTDLGTLSEGLKKNKKKYIEEFIQSGGNSGFDKIFNVFLREKIIAEKMAMKSEDFDKKFLQVKKEILDQKNLDKNKYFEYQKVYKKIEDFAEENFEKNDVENLKVFLQNFDEKNGNILTNNLVRKEYEKKLKEFDVEGTALAERKKENEMLGKILEKNENKIQEKKEELDGLKIEEKNLQKSLQNLSEKIKDFDGKIKDKNNEIFHLQNLKEKLENDTEKIRKIKQSDEYEKKLFDLTVNNATDEEKKEVVSKVIRTMDRNAKFELFKGLVSEDDMVEVENDVLDDLKSEMKANIYDNLLFMLNDLEFWYRKFIEEIMQKKYDNYAPCIDVALSSNERDENNVPILFDFLNEIVAKIRVFFLGKKNEDKKEIENDVETLKKQAFEKKRTR